MSSSEHLLVAPQDEVGLDAGAEARQAHLLQARDLPDGEGLVAQVVQGRSPPQRHRRMERLGRRGGLAAIEGGGALPGQAGEAIGIDGLRLVEREGVAAAVPGDRLGAHGRAQPGDDHLQRVGGVRRELLAPERVDRAVGGDRLAAAHEQQAEKAQRLAAHGHDPAVRIESLRRAQGCGTARSSRPGTTPHCDCGGNGGAAKGQTPCKRSISRRSAAARAPPPEAGTSGCARTPRWAPRRAAGPPAGAPAPPR